MHYERQYCVEMLPTLRAPDGKAERFIHTRMREWAYGRSLPATEAA